jgi:HEAT repeat protein
LVGDPASIPVLSELLASPDAGNRVLATRCLQAVDRPGALPAVPALLPLLGDPDQGVREAAREALAAIDPDALAAYDRGHPGAAREGGD